ncbi:MAG: transglutaminase domain-containing protein, partial [Candidatus Methanomethylicia archaeon]
MGSRGYIGVIVLLSVIIFCETVLYMQAQENYATFDTKYMDLYNKYMDLYSKYNYLYGKYNSLYNEYEDLYDKYDALKKDYDVEKTFSIGNSLAFYYDLVRSNYGPRSGWTDKQCLQFMVNLALHDLGYNVWPSLEGTFYTQTGKYSYEVAYKIINVALNFAEASKSKTPVENIKNILSFIHQYIHYEYDLGDTNSAPVETLAYKSGDCDDFGVLAAALFKSVGINVAIARFKNKDVTASKQGHIM